MHCFPRDLHNGNTCSDVFVFVVVVVVAVVVVVVASLLESMFIELLVVLQHPWER